MVFSYDVILDRGAEQTEGLPDQGYYEAIRAALSPEYLDLGDDEIDDLVEHVLEGLAPEEIESFWKTVRQIGAQALPIVAPVVGTAIGGPVGGALGGMAGRLAGQALAGRRDRQPTQSPVRGPAARAQAPLPAGASSAAAQLMTLLQNPAFLQTPLGQVLGPMGRQSVRVGKQGTPAPFPAFMNALSALANQAAMDANTAATQETPEYLMTEGDLLVDDPAVPEQRAVALLEQLREAYDHRDAMENTGLFEAADGEEDALTEWFVEAGLVEQHYPWRRQGYYPGHRRHPYASR